MANRKTWQQRQAELKKDAIVEILNRPKGESVLASIRRISAAYNGKRLPDNKRLRLSVRSLIRIWYLWKKNPVDSVFDVNYAGPEVQPSIAPWAKLLIVEFAVTHGFTIPQAHARLSKAVPDLPFCERTLRRHISEADRKRIAKAIKLKKGKAALVREEEVLNAGGLQ
ncbi:hypothetical protein P4E94_14810 [Pontiellaceae bacterium B12219]|nr:hypothetical protein [Pontiellaceae bacterium B12219]